MSRRALVALAALLVDASVALAAPTLPTRFLATPVYGTPPAIRIAWTEGTGTTYYTLWKKTGTGPDTVLAAIPAATPGHRAVFVDTAVAPHTQYAYRLDACDAATCLNVPSFFTSVDTVWPISGGRRVMQGFNENIASAGIRGDTGTIAAFHDGVDLGRTTTGGTAADDVLAPRGGIVIEIAMPPSPSVDDGFIQIAVDVGGGKFEFDGFNHIATGTPLPVMVGDAVFPGQRIATIGSRHFDRTPATPSAFDDHVHFQLGASGTVRTTVRHPLSIFNDDADRDPLGNPPALNDENGDGQVVRYRDRTSGNFVDYDLATKPLRGDLDVAVEVTDRQGTKPEQAPIRLGYWIEGPLPASEHLDDVKSATNPYRLHDFRTEYYGLTPGTACDLISAVEDVTNFGCSGVKANGCLKDAPGCTSPFKETGTNIPWMWPILHHFVVTHAGNETAARAGLSKNQFWRTAAKDDGGAVGSAHANYAGQATTTKAWEARFPDGDYTIHVLASDLVHTDVDLKLPPARLENFAPFVRDVRLAVDADGNPGTGPAETPGCELEVYGYRHPARKSYPDAFTLAVTRAAAGLTPMRAGAVVCVQVRFSEPMSSADVALVGLRGTGPVLAALAGALAKTHQDADTWRGKVTLVADPSGNSDSNLANDEKDVAIRVSARDRRDAANVTRTLDTDGDGTGNPSGDVNHLVKVDLSPMKKTLLVIK